MPVRRVSIEEALRLFATNNLELRISRATAAQSTGLARQQSAYPNPGLLLSHESVSSAVADHSETYFNLSQRVDWPWMTAARRHAASSRAAAGRAQVSADSIRLAYDVLRTFMEAATSEQVTATMAEAAALVGRAETQATARAAAGDVSGYELRRLRIERARYENELSGATLAMRAARRRLAALVLPDSSVEVSPVALADQVPASITLTSVLDAGSQEHPLVAEATASTEAAEALRRAAGAERLPSPAVTAGYKRQSDGLSGPYLSAGISVPLFDRRGAAVSAAVAEEDVARIRADLVTRNVSNDIRNAFDRYEAARTRLVSLGAGGLAATDTLLSIARVSYAEGEMSLVELLDAVGAYRTARIAATEVRANAWTTFYDLERASGMPLGGRAPEAR